MSIALTAVKRLLEKYDTDPRDFGRRAREGLLGAVMQVWPSCSPALPVVTDHSVCHHSLTLEADQTTLLIKDGRSLPRAWQSAL